MMNKLTPNDRSSLQEAGLQTGDERDLWQQPELTLLGRLGDLVQGGGKTGGVFDSDPQGTQKQGTG